MPLRKNETDERDPGQDPQEEVAQAAPEPAPPAPAPAPAAPVVRKFKAVKINMRDPTTGIMYYMQYPVPGEDTAWLRAQVKAGVIIEV